MSDASSDLSTGAEAQSNAAGVPFARAVPLNYASGSYQSYASAAPRARRVVRWLRAAVVAQLAWFFPLAVAVSARREMDAGREATEALTTAALVGSAVELAAGIVFLVALVLWLTWVHRAYRNLPALGAEGLRFSPGWAVAYYFIPIASFYRPFQVMRETWRASDPNHGGGTAWRAVAVPRLVSVWWGLSLVSIAASMASLGFELQEEDPRALLTASWIDLGTGVVDLVLVGVQIVLVKRLTALQERRSTGWGETMG